MVPWHKVNDIGATKVYQMVHYIELIQNDIPLQKLLTFLQGILFLISMG